MSQASVLTDCKRCCLPLERTNMLDFKIKLCLKVFSALIILLQCADAQLNFQYNQGTQSLDLLCEPGDLTLSGLSHLDSLIISREVNGQWQVLASISAHYSSNGPVNNVPNAIVTGQIPSDISSLSFLQVAWDMVGADLNGNYKCEAYGVDGNLLPTVLNRELNVKLKHLDFVFTTQPEMISVGFTTMLELNCSIIDATSLNMSSLSSLSIFRIHDGVDQILVDVHFGHSANVHTGSNVSSVTGSLEATEGFVTAGWSNPDREYAGEYRCEAMGTGTKGEPLFLPANLNVTWEEPDRQDLINRLFEMYRYQEEWQKLLTQYQRLIQEQEEEIQRLNKSDCPRRCDDLVVLSVGQHEVLLTPDDQGPISVVCDVRGPGEIWTIFQKRFNGSVDFYQNFSSYENGFGSIDGEYWLGLRNIRRLQLVDGGSHELRVDMVEKSGIPHIRIYPTFSIGSGDAYTIQVSGFDDGSYGMSHDDGMSFSTYDHGPQREVASTNRRRAGWWFPADWGYVNLNGVWGVIGGQSSIFWYEFGQNLNTVMTQTEMKFRSKN